MSWDDFGTFLHGTGPTLTVMDPDMNPNNILQKNMGGSCRVDWSFTGPANLFLNPTTFNVTLFAESIGPGPEARVGSVSIPGSAHTPTWDYSVTVAIPPNSLLAEGEGPPPGASGIYRLTAVITNSVPMPPPAPPQRDVLGGFVEGPVIEIRNP